MNKIIVPRKLEPFIQAFYVKSKKAVKELILQAAKAIYESGDDGNYSFGDKQQITPEELEGIWSLIQSIKPQDTLEALYAAQVVVSHLLGLRKLAKGSIDDQRLGLKLLKLSNEAITNLQRKRLGGMQNIMVNYNYSETETKVFPTVIPEKIMED